MRVARGIVAPHHADAQAAATPDVTTTQDNEAVMNALAGNQLAR
jgi:hypothetical protein